ncbi:DgyrCDS5098 [Dimorphilus gyrociliatus]|uniref:DgyrCDS5098 n=1 Tax=Dimorphilus gyrociliatus TaxID=2664684 RepID=A0A7I8VKE4_9ANNE|nr:DgyrCDS5098 [Dimorphilus gyrociliatus]
MVEQSEEGDVTYIYRISHCDSEHSDTWLGALYAYKGVLLIFGVYMAWETRRVKIPALNDSHYIGMNVYNVVLTSAIVVALSSLLADRRVSLSLSLSHTLSVSLYLSSFLPSFPLSKKEFSLIVAPPAGRPCVTPSSVCILQLIGQRLLFTDKGMHSGKALGRKVCGTLVGEVYAIIRHNGNPVIASTGITVEANTRRFMVDDKQEVYYRAQVQNRVYKRQLVQLDQEIARLEQLLSIPVPPVGPLSEDLLALLPFGDIEKKEEPVEPKAEALAFISTSVTDKTDARKFLRKFSMTALLDKTNKKRSNQTSRISTASEQRPYSRSLPSEKPAIVEEENQDVITNEEYRENSPPTSSTKAADNNEDDGYV